MHNMAMLMMMDECSELIGFGGKKKTCPKALIIWVPLVLD